METIFALHQDYRFVGEWWLPGQEENKVIGCLNYSPETGLNLDLEGHFTQNEFTTLNGYASGRHITLFDCFSRTMVTPFQRMVQYAPTEITANFAIVNLIAQTQASLELEWATFETNDIKTWSCLTGINERLFHEEIDKGNNTFTLAYSLPETQHIYSNDEAEITLNASINLPSLLPPPTEIVLKERNYFKIVNTGNQKGLFFFEYIDAIRKFISLATRSNIEILNVKITPQGSREKAYVLY